jgi:hypothetical protein
MEANSGIPNKNMLICPSVATGPWTPENVWDTGFLNQYSDHLYALAVEQYVVVFFHSVFLLSSSSCTFNLSVIPTTTVQPNSPSTVPS